jgi:hypothetical protein
MWIKPLPTSTDLYITKPGWTTSLISTRQRQRFPTIFPDHT